MRRRWVTATHNAARHCTIVLSAIRAMNIRGAIPLAAAKQRQYSWVVFKISENCDGDENHT
jgi:hypothetical protein